jgi:tetratricopeptide (TPR) repeat protein
MVLVLANAAPAQALDRQLRPDEVSTLEANLKKDPKNEASRRFLFDHYVREKQWVEAAAVGQPAPEALTQAQLLTLADVCIALEDGGALLSGVTYYNGKFQPMAHTRYLEGMAYFYMGKANKLLLKKREHGTTAIGFFKDSIRLDPAPTEAYFAWLKTLKEFWVQYYDDAIQVYRLLDLNSKTKDAYLAEKCELYFDSHLWNEASEVCALSVEKYPEKVDSYARLAATLQVRGDNEKARAVLLRALKRNPKAFAVQKGAGDLYLSEANYVKASEYYYTALKLDPTATPVYLSLALAEFNLKRYPEALSAFHVNCFNAKKIPKEFINATGQLRDNIPLHNKYKLVMSSCQAIKP